MSEMITDIPATSYAPELSIQSVSFANYDPNLAKRSLSVLRSELSRALTPQMQWEQISTSADTAPLALELTARDFSSPERLGKALARAILRKMGL